MMEDEELDEGLDCLDLLEETPGTLRGLMRELSHEDAEWKPAPDRFSVAEVLAHISRGRGTWAEGTCEPEKFLVNGDKVVVYLHVRVRLKDSTEWIDGRFADGFVFRAGKIIEYLTFAERAQALEWAGVAD